MYKSILFISLGAFADLKIQTTTVTTIKPATVTQVGPPVIPTVAPVVYGSAALAAMQAAQANQAAAAAAAAQQNQSNQQSQQMIQKALQSLGGGGGAGGAGGANPSGGGFPAGYKGPSTASTAAPSGQDGFQYVEPGKVDSCPVGTAIPAKVTQALEQAKTFRNGCRAANRGPDQKIAINDYSCEGTPKMWIFDAQGKCISSTAVTYGNGNGKSSGQKCPLACAQKDSDMTPPGFHLTSRHEQSNQGKRYGPTDSMILVSLEGQESSARGILIHKAANPGTDSSHGCSGVCETCYDKVAQTLGYGALVYNYFGDSPQTASGCGSQAGITHNPSTCSVEGAVSSGTPPTGSSSDTSR